MKCKNLSDTSWPQSRCKVCRADPIFWDITEETKNQIRHNRLCTFKLHQTMYWSVPCSRKGSEARYQRVSQANGCAPVGRADIGQSCVGWQSETVSFSDERHIYIYPKLGIQVMEVMRLCISVWYCNVMTFKFLFFLCKQVPPHVISHSIFCSTILNLNMYQIHLMSLNKPQWVSSHIRTIILTLHLCWSARWRFVLFCLCSFTDWQHRQGIFSPYVRAAAAVQKTSFHL